ncbi:dnaJ homolog subfamily B member 1-like [Toxorhynchites rutilus septentrionalis]|uniref:dnaJ homolog subfamily B member 1-like n=1 Tax=Toxorhynchites rutilus septentrionalis TaxID=329112 RepID=UPI0024798BDA|nr:dnaJ homolog subfamily B member 1-like [Toxorhynchites rutilus septentrionalis]
MSLQESTRNMSQPVAGSRKDYTPDQQKIVDRINACTDYYEMLEVPDNAPGSIIKNAYKKLALRLHPDKNKAPGAEEAFKSVANAYTILADESNRAKYDYYRKNPNFPMEETVITSNIDPYVVFICVGIGVGVITATLIWKLFTQKKKPNQKQISK